MSTSMKMLTIVLLVCAVSNLAWAGTPVFINEIHYDNDSTDVGEAIEIAGPAGTDLTGWSIVLYNGSVGTVYGGTQYLSGTIPDRTGGYGFVVIEYASNGLQNGAPDGMALIDASDTVVQFLSYEGSFTAVGGPADGMISTDIGVSEPGNSPVGYSLQLTGSGMNYEDFTWAAPAAHTFNALNNGQAFTGSSDTPPSVLSTSPADGAANVALDTNIVLTFNENVMVTDPWFTITCTNSGAHAATVSGGAHTYTLDPAVDFVNAETCTVTIIAEHVIDQDEILTPMAANVTFTFTTVAGITKIHDIQGTTDVSPAVDEIRTIEGVVTADFQAADQLYGFFVQEEDSDVDANPLTSEGLFVYSSNFAVNVGDVVRVTGTVKEYNGLTELTAVSAVEVKASGVSLPAITTLDLPIPAGTSLEPYEGMSVTILETLTAAQNYFQGRYGQVTLSAEGRMYQPTHLYTPGSPEAVALTDENSRRMIVLDDGSSKQNPAPIPYIGLDTTLRAGDTIENLTGVLDFGPISSTSTIRHYRVHPTETVSFTRVNDRTDQPEPVGGTVKVASFNVLNYFNGDGLGGGFPTSRGASTSEEFTRQRNKIINAIRAIDADVIGLMEMENDARPNSAIEDLVSGLNEAAGAGTYAFIDTGVLGNDEIRVALLYKPGTVSPFGSFAVLDSSVDPQFQDDRNRPALAQTFEAAGEKFTVVVNHLKSKGCDEATGEDLDQGDGQGCWNKTRTDAANVLTNWLNSDPTASGDLDFLIIGDLNSYAMEDPITAIKDAGYTNLLSTFKGAEAYSYIFDGLSGYLDHALASPTLAAQASGATEWHINADEPSVIDYNTEYKPQDLYTSEPYRASDHDPVVIGLNLRSTFDASKEVDLAFDRIPETSEIDLFAGDMFTYTLAIENPFEQAAYFNIIDTLDEYLEYLSGPFTLNGDGDWEFTTHLEAGDFFSFSFDVKVQDVVPVGAIIENIAIITAYLDPGNILGTTLAIVEATSVNIHAVPEPSMLILLGSGLIGIFALLRRKRR